MSNRQTSLFNLFFPFLRWLPELSDKKTLRADIIAGVTVALVLIPQSMAYAALAGLPPYYGLYAAFLPPIIAALLGSSRQLATGPVAVVSLLTASALGPIAAAGSDGYLVYAVLLAFMVGLFQLALGLLRLGVLVNFLSHPVVMGFTNAAAIIIATSQLPKIFGISVERTEHHYEYVWNTIVTAASETNFTSLSFAVLALAIMILLKRKMPKLPGVLFAVAITTGLSFALEYEKLQTVPVTQVSDAKISEVLSKYQGQVANSNKLLSSLNKFEEGSADYLAVQEGIEAAKAKQQATLKFIKQQKLVLVDNSQNAELPNQLMLASSVASGVKTDGNVWRFGSFADNGGINLRAGGSVVGAIPQGLPSFSIPSFDLATIQQLVFAAITIALIGFMEAISIAKAMATRTRQRLDTNQELIGQGLSNIIGSMFQSYPVSGSFSRSAVNIGAGAVTGFSSVVTGLVVVLVLLFLTPLLYHLPQATLAAVIMMAVIGLVNVKHFKHTWSVYRSDGIIATTTFVLTLFFAPHLENAIIIGVLLSLGIFLYRTMKPRVAYLGRYKDGTLRDAEVNKLDTCTHITIIRYDGSLYFANTSYFEDIVMERSAEKPELKYIVVDGQGINQIDATGEEMLASLTRRLAKTDVTMVFANFKRQVLQVLKNSGFFEQMGQERFFPHTELAIDAITEELDKGDSHDVTECPLTIACVVEAADS